jgi:hypothetical protein
MQRYVVDQFDEDTFVVIDQNEQREVCVCSKYDDWEDAKKRAHTITQLLNESNEKTLG